MFYAWPREVDGSKTCLQMFYFTCNHGLRFLHIKCVLLHQRYASSTDNNAHDTTLKHLTSAA